MRFIFYVSQGKSREAPLCEAWIKGARASGDELVVKPNDVKQPEPGDVAIMVGLKSIDFRFKCQALGQRVLTFDKGYDRKHDWWRVSIDTHQPTRYLMQMQRTPDRMHACGWIEKPWREDHENNPVIIAGGGRKYYNAHDLPDPVEYVGDIVSSIRAAGCRRKIFYRPKPSMSDVQPVPGTILSRHKSIYEILDNAHALITFGSNACFEAMLSGVPSIVLGDAIARPISSTSLDDINAPLLAAPDDRARLLASLSYCQFRLNELASGWAIDELKTQLWRDVRKATSGEA